jgi:simple sugar transport system ATP-binding protein
MRDECQAGACALVVSFDLDELLDHCDRVFVMRDGLLHQPKSNLREEIGALMVRSA